MYDHLTGTVVEVGAARAVLSVGGVGYELKVPTGSGLLRDSEATLYTLLHVTDGNPTLLGFASKLQRDFARLLMSVSGVGPAMTLAVLSTWPEEQLAAAIVAGEHGLLKKVKGVGAKTAERLCLELRDKVQKLGLALDGVAVPEVQAEGLSAAGEDAVSALVVLGYSEKEARGKVGKALKSDGAAETEQLITAVLRGG